MAKKYPNKVRIDMVSLEDDRLLVSVVPNDASLEEHALAAVAEMELHLTELNRKGTKT